MALEQDASRGITPGESVSIGDLLLGTAANDATLEDAELSKLDVEALLWPARAARADDPAIDTALPEPMTSYELHIAARAHRSFLLGEIIAAVISSVAASARRARSRYRERREAAVLVDALHQFDPHMLRDLGLERSETRSVAAEFAGIGEYVRERTRAEPQRTGHGRRA